MIDLSLGDVDLQGRNSHPSHCCQGLASGEKSLVGAVASILPKFGRFERNVGLVDVAAIGLIGIEPA